jgi:CBS domain-containing protein
MSTTVRQIIARKPQVYSVSPSTTVFDALRVMAEHNIGALLVLENEEAIGVFSERDYARKVILHGKSSKELTVGEIMTSPVVCADPAWSAHDCMAMMSQWRVRHLPVIVDGQVVGVISIGDVVSAVVSEQASTIRNLEHYIASGS